MDRFHIHARRGTSKTFSKVKKTCYGNRQVFKKLIDRLIEASSDYLCLQAEAGAEALQIFDTWSGVLPEKEFAKWCIEPCQRIIENVRQKHPNIPIICFPKGAGLLYEDFVRQTRCTAISLDASVPLDWARRILQPLVPIQGNLDPCALVVGGNFLDASVDNILGILPGDPLFSIWVMASCPRRRRNMWIVSSKEFRSFKRKTPL